MKNKIIIATILLSCNHTQIYSNSSGNSRRSTSVKQDLVQAIKNNSNNATIKKEVQNLFKKNKNLIFNQKNKEIQKIDKQINALQTTQKKFAQTYIEKLREMNKEIQYSLKYNSVPGICFSFLDGYNKMKETPQFAQYVLNSIITESSNFMYTAAQYLYSNAYYNKVQLKKFVETFPQIFQARKQGKNYTFDTKKITFADFFNDAIKYYNRVKVLKTETQIITNLLQAIKNNSSDATIKKEVQNLFIKNNDLIFNKKNPKIQEIDKQINALQTTQKKVAQTYIEKLRDINKSIQYSLINDSIKTSLNLFQKKYNTMKKEPQFAQYFLNSIITKNIPPNGGIFYQYVYWLTSGNKSKAEAVKKKL